jgi:hypothetical protein
MTLITFPRTSRIAARRSGPTEATQGRLRRCNVDDCEAVVRQDVAFCAHHASLLTNELRFALTINRVAGSIFRYLNAVEDAREFIGNREPSARTITAR